MVDPFAMTIATNVATKITDTLTDQVQQAVAAIIRRIREKLRSRPDQLGEVATLDATVAAGDASAVEALTRTLEQLFTADPDFRDEIHALWDSARSDDSVTNIFHVKAEKVIMMRDVNGDLTIS
jgi:predicted short-subunit dehydrogenase-like oxidoreductase (DUF2520 family)